MYTAFVYFASIKCSAVSGCRRIWSSARTRGKNMPDDRCATTVGGGGVYTRIFTHRFANALESLFVSARPLQQTLRLNRGLLLA